MDKTTWTTNLARVSQPFKSLVFWKNRCFEIKFDFSSLSFHGLPYSMEYRAFEHFRKMGTKSDKPHKITRFLTKDDETFPGKTGSRKRSEIQSQRVNHFIFKWRGVGKIRPDGGS